VEEVCDIVVDTEDAEVVIFLDSFVVVACVVSSGKFCLSNVISTGVNFLVCGGFVFFVLLFVDGGGIIVLCFSISAYAVDAAVRTGLSRRRGYRWCRVVTSSLSAIWVS